MILYHCGHVLSSVRAARYGCLLVDHRKKDYTRLSGLNKTPVHLIPSEKPFLKKTKTKQSKTNNQTASHERTAQQL